MEPDPRRRRVRGQARRRLPHVELVHGRRDRARAARPGAARGTALDVVVGGLGLGYTARARAPDDPRVRSLRRGRGARAEVIDWHERGLLPLSAPADRRPAVPARRGRLLRAGRRTGLRSRGPRTRFDAVLVDIDHSPRHVLHPRHAAFYTPAGLRQRRRAPAPGGVFALWSDDPPDDDFGDALAEVFATGRGQVVDFPNPLHRRDVGQHRLRRDRGMTSPAATAWRRPCQETRQKGDPGQPASSYPFALIWLRVTEVLSLTSRTHRHRHDREWSCAGSQRSRPPQRRLPLLELAHGVGRNASVATPGMNASAARRAFEVGRPSAKSAAHASARERRIPQRQQMRACPSRVHAGSVEVRRESASGSAQSLFTGSSPGAPVAPDHHSHCCDASGNARWAKQARVTFVKRATAPMRENQQEAADEHPARGRPRC